METRKLPRKNDCVEVRGKRTRGFLRSGTVALHEIQAHTEHTVLAARIEPADTDPRRDSLLRRPRRILQLRNRKAGRDVLV